MMGVKGGGKTYHWGNATSIGWVASSSAILRILVEAVT